jgi:malonyl-CoA/methylmalonyl-CoA synthetase
MANAFRDMGIKKGDRVFLFLPKCLFFVTAYLAIQKLGAIAVPLNPGFTKTEVSYFIQDTDPKVVISGPEQAAMVKEIAPDLTQLVIETRNPYQELEFSRSFSDEITQVDVRPEDPGLILYTSGTTGRPKGAVLTNRNLVFDAKNVISTWEIKESDAVCHALPLFHVHGLCFALQTTLMAGGHVLMLDQFSSETVIKVLTKKGEYSCTVFMAVPAMYVTLMEFIGEKKLDFEHIRLWTSGSAPLLPKDFDRIKKVFGREPVEREGMSETGMNFSNPIRGKRKPGSIGIPLPGLEVRIVDPETFRDVARGQTGELWLKGPAITQGYWKKPDETERAFDKGWFKTGDLGMVDEAGYYFLIDRIKHVIISGGENISPKEVEEVINKLEDVLESSVVGVPDEKWGEKVVAAVVAKPGAELKPTEIQAYCKQHLHNWKCPKEVVFLERLPKNTMGKVLKEEVRKVFRL